MKKTLIGIGVITLCITLTACSNNSSQKSSVGSSSSVSSKRPAKSEAIVRTDWVQPLNEYDAWVDKYNVVLTNYKTEINSIGAEMSTRLNSAYDPNAKGTDGVAGGDVPDVSDLLEKQQAAQNQLLTEYNSMINESSQWKTKLNTIEKTLTEEDLVNYNEKLSSIEQKRDALLSEMKASTFATNS